MNPRTATGLIVTLTVILGGCSGIYWALGRDQTQNLPYIIWYVAWWWALTLWVVRDARERGLPLAFDQGLFVYLAWPVYIPIYLVRSRGASGILWLLVFAGIYAVSVFAAATATAIAWRVMGP